MRRTVSVKAFAKLNLGLRILGRRADGFHELRTVYQTISLCDELEVSLGGRAGGSPVRLDLLGLEVPPGQDNLAARAAVGMQRALGLKQQVHILLRKRIPTGGGLGGGSSDAAAVLRALDRLSGGMLDRRKLFQLAASLGSDVPFFLFGGRAVGVGRGEEVYPLPDGSAQHCVVALPDVGMSTAEAYRLLNAVAWPGRGGWLQAKRARPNPQPSLETFSAALLAEFTHAAGRSVPPIPNDFEPILFERFPVLAAAKKNLLNSGASWAALTGSGSAIFGLFRERATATAASRRLERTGMRVIRCRTIRRASYAAALRVN